MKTNVDTGRLSSLLDEAEEESRNLSSDAEVRGNVGEAEDYDRIADMLRDAQDVLRSY